MQDKHKHKHRATQTPTQTQRPEPFLPELNPTQDILPTFPTTAHREHVSHRCQIKHNKHPQLIQQTNIGARKILLLN